MIRIAPIARDVITPEWIEERREIIAREGRAVRAGLGRDGFTIEVKSLVTNEWHVLTLPGNALEFALFVDRDEVMRALQGGTP